MKRSPGNSLESQEVLGASPGSEEVPGASLESPEAPGVSPGGRKVPESSPGSREAPGFRKGLSYTREKEICYKILLFQRPDREAFGNLFSLPALQLPGGRKAQCGRGEKPDLDHGKHPVYGA